MRAIWVMKISTARLAPKRLKKQMWIFFPLVAAKNLFPGRVCPQPVSPWSSRPMRRNGLAGPVASGNVQGNQGNSLIRLDTLKLLISGKKYWIRNQYFCDGRANCPQNPLTQESSDEETRVCSTTAAPPTTTTQRPTYYSESEKPKEERK